MKRANAAKCSPGKTMPKPGSAICGTPRLKCYLGLVFRRIPTVTASNCVIAPMEIYTETFFEALEPTGAS